MKKEGGVFTIPCEVNGLKLKFVFDTGASDVSISMTEALFMLKNDYLSENDIKGTMKYRTASGAIEEGTTLLLRKIKIGNKYLYNVEASVVNSLDAPLLLGQTALSKLGNISIDYVTNQLIIGNPDGVKKANPTTPISAPKETTRFDDFKTVKIGNQLWMAENLNSDRFQNGDLIPNAVTSEEWLRAGENKQAAWCYYDNDPKNGNIYGKLYNWYAVSDPRNVCPNGWHIPSDDEWTQLELALGMTLTEASYSLHYSSANVGGKLKAIEIWQSPNKGATNSSGFTGLPGGFRIFENGTFFYIGKLGSWWSYLESSSTSVWVRYLDTSYGNISRNNLDKQNGFSARCIKN